MTSYIHGSGPFHGFLLLKEHQVNYEESFDYINSKKQILLPDDLILYMKDTFVWIPSIDPRCLETSLESQDFGINYYGATIINKKGAKIFGNIIRAWIDLFTNAPTHLKLTGVWIENVNDDGTDSGGYYKTITLRRDAVIKTLKILIDYADRTISGEYFILHFGI